jgi:HTH-type transcriptional regulator / antitoxin HigA
MKREIETRPTRLPKTWAGLNRLLPLRPIRDQAGYEAAQKIVDALAVMDKRTKDQEDYLDTLTGLFEFYEQRHFRFETSDLDAIEILRFLMVERGMNASDLGRILGHARLGSMILRGERGLSKAHIEKLCEVFKVGPGLFLNIHPGPRQKKKTLAADYRAVASR